MSGEGKDEQNKHPLEQYLESIVLKCQHIAAISKGLCVKGVSHDVSIRHLENQSSLKDSDSLKVLKEECGRCQSLLSDCLVTLNGFTDTYLQEYNKSVNGKEENTSLTNNTASADDKTTNISNNKPDTSTTVTPAPATAAATASAPTPAATASVPAPATPATPATPAAKTIPAQPAVKKAAAKAKK